MRTIGVVTVGRSDYGIYLPILRRIKSSNDLRLHLIVSGMHLSQEFGRTVAEIENDGFKIEIADLSGILMMKKYWQFVIAILKMMNIMTRLLLN